MVGTWNFVLKWFPFRDMLIFGRVAFWSINNLSFPSSSLSRGWNSKRRAFHTLHRGQRIITQLRAKLFQTNLDILGKSSKVATDVFAIFSRYEAAVIQDEFKLQTWMNDIYGYMWSIHICLNDMFDMPSTQLTSLLGCWPAILCVKASKMWVIWVLGAYCVYWASSRRFCNPNTHCLQNCEVVSWWSSTDPWYLNGVRFVIHFGSSMLTRFIAITHASDHSPSKSSDCLLCHTMHLWQSSNLLHYISTSKHTLKHVCIHQH